MTLHLPLAAAAARRYRAGAEWEDLLQVARSGLLEAFDRYDPTRASYQHFALVTMHGLLRRHLRDHAWAIRPTRTDQEAALVLRQREPELTQSLRRAPTAVDLAEELGWSVADVWDARRSQAGRHVASLDVLTDHHPIGAADDTWHVVEARAILRGPLRSLTADDRELLRLRFVEQLSQEQIGGIIGISQMQVSRRLSRLLARLRAAIGTLHDDHHDEDSRARPSTRRHHREPIDV